MGGPDQNQCVHMKGGAITKIPLSIKWAQVIIPSFFPRKLSSFADSAGEKIELDRRRRRTCNQRRTSSMKNGAPSPRFYNHRHQVTHSLLRDLLLFYQFYFLLFKPIQVYKLGSCNSWDFLLKQPSLSLQPSELFDSASQLEVRRRNSCEESHRADIKQSPATALKQATQRLCQPVRGSPESKEESHRVDPDSHSTTVAATTIIILAFFCFFALLINIWSCD